MKKTKTNIEKLLNNLEKPKAVTIKYTVGDEEILVKAFSTIPFRKRAELIECISNLMFGMSENQNEINYQPQYSEFAIKYSIIRFYSDVVLPEDVDTIWLILDKTSLFDDICENIEDDLNVIYKQADELVDARKQYLIQHKDFNDLKDKVKDKVNEILNKFTNLDLDTILAEIPNMELGLSNNTDILPEIKD